MKLNQNIRCEIILDPPMSEEELARIDAGLKEYLADLTQINLEEIAAESGLTVEEYEASIVHPVWRDGQWWHGEHKE